MDSRRGRLALKIVEMSYYLPEKFLTAEDLAKRFGVSKEWIKRRTSIEKIYISQLSVLEMAFEASKNLSEEYEGLIFVSSKGTAYIPYYMQLLKALGKNETKFGLDVMDGFNGFVKSMYLAEHFLKEKFKRLLIVVSEKMSDFVRDDDIDTSILFSDAAVAMVVELENNVTADFYQIQDLNYMNFLSLDSQKKLSMEGKQVYKFAVSNMIRIFKKLSENVDPSTKFVIVPHQANGRILQAVEKELRKEERDFELLNCIQDFGNVGSASIPIALLKKYQKGPFSLKNHIFVSVSGGMSALGMCWKEVKTLNENNYKNYRVAGHRVSNY